MCAELLHYAGCAAAVEGLGPGRRTVLWVSGCARACPGCMAPELWPRGQARPVEDVAAEVLPLLEYSDGLSISGGEPFEQAAALCELVRLLRARRDVELLVYTGYLWEELADGAPDKRELLALCDLLVDGPYREDLPGTLRWRGSDNQRVHMLSPRARAYAGLADLPWGDARPLQLRMLEPGRFLVIGIPRRGDLQELRRRLRERGIEVISKDVDRRT